MPARRAPKIEALVVNAIRRLQDMQGSSPREISNYISQEYDVPGGKIKRQVQLALQRGLSYGILQRSKGGYTCNNDYFGPLLGDGTGDEVTEVCHPSQSRFRFIWRARRARRLRRARAKKARERRARLKREKAKRARARREGARKTRARRGRRRPRRRAVSRGRRRRRRVSRRRRRRPSRRRSRTRRRSRSRRIRTRVDPSEMEMEAAAGQNGFDENFKDENEQHLQNSPENSQSSNTPNDDQ